MKFSLFFRTITITTFSSFLFYFYAKHHSYFYVTVSFFSFCQHTFTEKKIIVIHYFAKLELVLFVQKKRYKFIKSTISECHISISNVFTAYCFYCFYHLISVFLSNMWGNHIFERNTLIKWSQYRCLSFLKVLRFD